MSRKKVVLVVPAYNEELAIEQFYERTCRILDQLPYIFCVLFVDDGSTDYTPSIIQNLTIKDDRVCVLRLSRNFGKEVALTAGLDHAYELDADATIVIDCDLQDPPELIVEFLSEWEGGYDVVCGRRRSRSEDSIFKRASAILFYSLMSRIGDRVRIPENVGDFRLLDKQVLNAIVRFREHHRFMKGLFAWVGFRQKEVLFDRPKRKRGKIKVGSRKASCVIN